ncbi:ATP synthase subunit e, mitochondrial [Lachnellula hyalina]|uniref:ATP synthase F(0) complex subunit e, mitochondrial n=1 Tax=Lachnellula hyalina TaxID=1316788 RepID=A0A8H8QXK6_9HELO|nr:ATP synthase subunit e, mitochondrial [Lachnellula hyalina]TVY24599.1 ATP synthase subunit e, mitochondrial [Lachnellula hyalina]
MASTGVNIARWSALGAGVFYGFYHQRSLTSASKAAAVDREYEHKQQLIQQAKAEFAKKNAPASSKPSGGAILDPNDSKFDLEALLNNLDAEAK